MKDMNGEPKKVKGTPPRTITSAASNAGGHSVSLSKSTCNTTASKPDKGQTDQATPQRTSSQPKGVQSHKRPASVTTNPKLTQNLEDMEDDESHGNQEGLPSARKRAKKENGCADESLTGSKFQDSAGNMPIDGAIETDHLDRPGIPVGYLKEDKNPELNNVRVPVIAFLNKALALKFRLSEEEAKASKIELKHRSHPYQTQIDFCSTYVGSEQAIRNAIKEDLKKKFPHYRDEDRNNAMRGPISSGGQEGGTIVVDAPPPGTDLEASPTSLANHSHAEIESTSEQQLSQALQHHKDTGAKLREAVRMYKRTFEDHIAALEQGIATKDAEAMAQEAANKEQSQIIADLHKKIEQLTKKTQFVQSSMPLVINDQVFDKFPAGDENEGLYVTQQARVVTVGDSSYDERIALSEFKNVYLGGDLTESVTMNEIPFKLISGGKYSGKLVQDLGPHSVFEHEGRFYIRWFIRTKKELSL